MKNLDQPATPLGTVNGFAPRKARIGSDVYTFNGTTKGLANLTHALGVPVGSKVFADYGLGMSRYIVTETGGGDRTPDGRWIRRA